MSGPPGDPARARWLTIMLVRVAGSAGALMGVVLAAKASDWPTKALGVGIVLAALYMLAVVPRALARRWRSAR